MIFEYLKWLDPSESVSTKHKSFNELISIISTDALVYWDKYTQNNLNVMTEDVGYIRLLRPSSPKSYFELQLYEEQYRPWFDIDINSRYPGSIISIHQYRYSNEWRRIWSK